MASGGDRERRSLSAIRMWRLSRRDTRFPCRFLKFWSFLGVGALTLFVGCQMAGTGFRPSPLDSVQQRQEIEKIVPLGTSRTEVEKRLREAGIEITPGSSSRLAYCDIWNRKGGDRWVLNVALLFDEEGKLYETRPAQAETGLFSSSTPGASDAAIRSAESQPQAEPTTSLRQTSAEQSTTSVTRGTDRRRTPFETPGPAYAP